MLLKQFFFEEAKICSFFLKPMYNTSFGIMFFEQLFNGEALSYADYLFEYWSYFYLRNKLFYTPFSAKNKSRGLFCFVAQDTVIKKSNFFFFLSFVMILSFVLEENTQYYIKNFLKRQYLLDDYYDNFFFTPASDYDDYWVDEVILQTGQNLVDFVSNTFRIVEINTYYNFFPKILKKKFFLFGLNITQESLYFSQAVMPFIFFNFYSYLWTFYYTYLQLNIFNFFKKYFYFLDSLESYFFYSLQKEHKCFFYISLVNLSYLTQFFKQKYEKKFYFKI